MSKSTENGASLPDESTPELAIEGFSTTRRGFIGGAAGVTGATLAGVLTNSVVSASPAEAARSAAPSPGESFRGFLVMDGESMALAGVEGGEVYAEVGANPGSPLDEKAPGPPQYEPIEMLCGTGMTKDFYSWISTSWKGAMETRDGSIVLADFNLKPVSQRNFTEGLIAETTIPKCDAASKDPARLRVLVDPVKTELVKPEDIKGTIGTKQKQWLQSNFRLTIDSIDCSRVSKIESFTVKQAMVAESPHVEVPNLVITFSAVSSKSWLAWFEKLVVDGQHDTELGGKLEFLGPNLRDVLGTVTFVRLGIVRISEGFDSGDAIRKMTAELYCEAMSFKVVT